MNKRRFLGIATCCAILTPTIALADAASDCHIVFDRSDGSTTLAHVVNTNRSRTIKVTVSCTESSFPNPPRRLPDRVFTLAPGAREFCGGTVSGNSQYRYEVAGAEYK